MFMMPMPHNQAKYRSGNQDLGTTSVAFICSMMDESVTNRPRGLLTARGRNVKPVQQQDFVSASRKRLHTFFASVTKTWLMVLVPVRRTEYVEYGM